MNQRSFLQCLTIQGLTSSGGGSSVGGDGVNSSGVSRALVKDRPLVGSGKNPQKYIKYGAEDLERMLGEFFEGKNLNEPKR
ncbi:exocyst complex component exo70a1 [Quercus suber]|uniref:Exocyst complex component exo70a1 n=1 Tax=Quercus suber TaxID=58331 RepID=A0AAW0M9U0_QUESU